ncbi:MAG: helix-turn-helix domain-containing protein, partial [Halobacterium sp.]
EIHAMYDALANAPFVERAETTHWNYSGGDLGIMHYVHGDSDRFAARLADIEDVERYDVTDVGDDSFYAYLLCDVDGPARQVFGALTQGRLVVNHPIEWTESGTVLVSVVGPAAEVQAAVEDIPDPVEVSVREIGGVGQTADAVGGVLSERQREAVEAALALDYYAIPRGATLEDVADEIGCARSTAAEHLRKSEEKVFDALYDS